MAFYSPLRYPGGKGDLANFMKLVYLENRLHNSAYIEPYAGGAGIALSLLFDGFTKNIYINDLDQAIFSFWYSILNETEAFCELVKTTPVTIDEWYRQQAIQEEAHEEDSKVSRLELGFSTFFLNRTNRSGIIKGGVIGGKNQDGPYKLDARFNRENLIERIRRIAKVRSQVSLTNKDAAEFLQTSLVELPTNSLVYLDPPYFEKGQGLYKNYYSVDDHKKISRLVNSIHQKWIVSYDNVPQIREMYANFRQMIYTLSYSATKQYKGSEVMIFSPEIIIPIVSCLTDIDRKYLNPSLFQV